MNSSVNRGLHRFTVFTTACTFLLLVAGALVTSNDAGLAVPDWPLSYGSLMPPMVGGIFYEHGHRVLATFVGFLTILLALWLWRCEPRPGVKRLGLLALGAVVAQGVLGGLTVRFYLPVAISVAHATLAQIFFGTVSSLALFTSAWWQQDLPRLEDSGTPRICTLARWSVAAIFLQLILGAVFRHRGFGIAPHLVGASVVVVLVFWLARALGRRYPMVPVLRRGSLLLQVLLGAQLLFGGAAWWSRALAREFPQPIAVTVWLTVVHTVTGAVVLAAAIGVLLVCYRILGAERQGVFRSPPVRATS
ncbi:MAG TPA: COX15/CtaA family protein [Candidatus Acidoferrales bacterium]|nr:COX15/CtaA family protein [Candidatus Acidoferrales bacterium]